IVNTGSADYDWVSGGLWLRRDSLLMEVEPVPVEAPGVRSAARRPQGRPPSLLPVRPLQVR
ncbi:MAG: hypothetical protein M3R46_18085, partial [Actinomycetota bacterium]|nr:hypothetical protein [Actinomycetota bacterium]